MKPHPIVNARRVTPRVAPTIKRLRAVGPRLRSNIDLWLTSNSFLSSCYYPSLSLSVRRLRMECLGPLIYIFNITRRQSILCPARIAAAIVFTPFVNLGKIAKAGLAGRTSAIALQHLGHVRAIGCSSSRAWVLRTSNSSFRVFQSFVDLRRSPRRWRHTYIAAGVERPALSSISLRVATLQRPGTSLYLRLATADCRLPSE